MNLAYVWGAGAVFAGWMILRLIGSERERKVREWEASRPPEPPPAPVEQKPTIPTAAAAKAPPARKAA
jgi:hypothetical protein